MSSMDSNRQNDLNQELHAAVREGNESNVVALLAQGADINAASKNGETALIEAAKHGHVGMVHILLSRNADVLYRPDFDQTALAYAVENDHAEIVRLLVDNGGLIDDVGTHGQSLLFLAAEHENDTILRLLIERGANTKNSGVLHAAAIQGDVTRLRYLLDKGLDVDAFHEDRTPVMLAAKYGPFEAVRFLIEQGADVNARAEDGHTVLSQSYKGVFKSKDDRKIASMLRKAGAHDDYDGFINIIIGLFYFFVFFQTIVTLPLHLPLNLFWHIADSRRSSKNKTPA